MRNNIPGILAAVCICAALSGCGTADPAVNTADTTATEPVFVQETIVEESTEQPAAIPETTEAPAAETIGETVPETPEETAPSEPAETISLVGLSREPVMDPPAVSDEPCTYFDDAAIIGDSITMALLVHNTRTQDLGNLLFLSRGSLGLFNTLHGVLSVSYQGVAMTPWDALKASGVSKVYIMLGTNDIGYWGIEETMKNWELFVANIRQSCPDIRIFIQSQTPMWTESEQALLTNANIDTYNGLLKEFAEANDCYFLDIAPYFKDETNGMAQVYCNDNYVHLSAQGTAVWAQILKAHAEEMEKEIN